MAYQSANSSAMAHTSLLSTAPAPALGLGPVLVLFAASLAVCLRGLAGIYLISEAGLVAATR